MTLPVPNPEADPRADHLRLAEALLFASATPIDEPSIAMRLPEGTDIAAVMRDLEALYRPRGVNVVRVAGGWSLRTAPDLGPRLRLEQKVVRKLSRAAIETLAIIAYHQPVTRAEIEAIRGVVISKGTLDALMETGWIAPKGRRQTVGRPVTWVTTEHFLIHFGLDDVRDLPGVEELRAAGLIGPRAVTTISENSLPPELAAEPGEASPDEEADWAAEFAQDEPEPAEEEPTGEDGEGN
jgi:segregation and condensation protein B